MIVVYQWKSCVMRNGTEITTVWKGVFLLGFIPLLIWIKFRSYQERIKAEAS